MPLKINELEGLVVRAQNKLKELQSESTSLQNTITELESRNVELQSALDSVKNLTYIPLGGAIVAVVAVVILVFQRRQA